METEFEVISQDDMIGSFEPVITESEGNSYDYVTFQEEWSDTGMDPEMIDAFIVRLRAGIDSLVDKIAEELEEVQSLLESGDTESALNKVQAMLKSIEESDSEDNN